MVYMISRLEQKIAGCVAAAAAAVRTVVQNLRVGSGTKRAGVLDGTVLGVFQKMTDVLAVPVSLHECFQFPMMLFA